MLAGQTVTYQGYQVALFPLDMVYITQKYDPTSPSHCCGKPIDCIGTHSIYPIYAPFDCVRTWNDYGSGYGDCGFTSLSQVWTPQGLENVSFILTHDDNPDFTKTTFRQGELIGHTGTTPIGLVTGDHIHIEASNIANATLIDSGISCAGFGNHCYYLNGAQEPNKIFYLTGDENILQTLGLEFETWHDSPITTSNFKWWMAKRMLDKRKRGD